ncbi:MAG: hypothetical protein A2W23_07845 [Planctomycetes bacterium RBG_16_43_13]|nr:MAG: hypothetical protein A2W23_07845 [Planctomycetes bacterium RBG_16_43_13]
MKRPLFLTLLLCLMLVSYTKSSLLFSLQDKGVKDRDKLEQLISDEINKKRSANGGLPALKLLDELSYIARQQADEFEQGGLRGHQGKEWGYCEQRVNAIFGWSAPLNQKPNSTTPSQDMMTDNSFDIDEEGHIDADELHWVIDGWMESPGHRQAILMNTTAQTGVGMSAKGTRIFQIFASLTAQRTKALEDIAKLAPDLFKEEAKALTAINKILALNEGAAVVRLSDVAKRSDKEKVRKKACEALYQLNKKIPAMKGVVPELIGFIEDETVGADAQKYLKALTGQGHGKDKNAWLKWWQTAKQNFSAK